MGGGVTWDFCCLYDAIKTFVTMRDGILEAKQIVYFQKVFNTATKPKVKLLVDRGEYLSEL